MARGTRVVDWGTAGKQSVANGGDGSLYYSAFDGSGDTLVARTNLGISVAAGTAAGQKAYRIAPAGWSTNWSGYELWDDGSGVAAADFEAVGDGGSGQFPIDHDGGSGTGGADCTFYIPYSNGVGVGSSADVLRYTTDGASGYGGLTIRAYLASAYDAGLRNAVGTTFTRSDGRWTGPLNLSAGTYYLIADVPDDSYAAYQVKVVVP